MVGQLEAYGALKLFILSSGRVGSGGVEEKRKKRRKKRRESVEEKSEGSERGERWWNGGRVNCVYSKNQYSFIFFCLQLEYMLLQPRRHVRILMSDQPKVSSCVRHIRCSVMWTQKDDFRSIGY